MGQELRGPDGKVLGYFVPTGEYERLLYDLAKAESARQAAEDRANGVTRGWDGTNGRTTADVLDLFRRLDAGESAR